MSKQVKILALKEPEGIILGWHEFYVVNDHTINDIM